MGRITSPKDWHSEGFSPPSPDRVSLRADLFVGAQTAFVLPNDVFTPLAEIYSGRKRTHWMWFVFPQHVDLGQSDKSKLFGLTFDQAREYVDHEILGRRLVDCCEAVLKRNEVPAGTMFGTIDAMKLRSSMTLFTFASPNPVFRSVLDDKFAGQTCLETLRRAF